MKRKDIFSNQLFARISQINRAIIGQLIVITFGSLLIDSFTYSGFLAKIVVINSTTLFYLSIISLFIYFLDSLFRTTEKQRLPFSILLQLNFLSFPFLFVLVFFLIQLEKQTYINFVFATYHLHLIVLTKIAYLSGLLALVYVIDTFFKTTKYDSKKIKFTTYFHKLDTNKSFFFLLMGIIVTVHTIGIYSAIAKAGITAVKFFFISTEERNRIVFGDPYFVYQFINQNTPPEAIIAVAPQSIEGIYGNIGFSRYFLHPRFLIHPEQDNIRIDDADYVIVSSYFDSSKNQNFDMWPKANLKISEGYIIDRFSLEVTKLDINEYVYGDSRYFNKLALLKVKKE